MGRFTCLCVLLLLAATPQAQRPQSTPGGQRVIVASTHGGRTATGRKGKHHPGVSGSDISVALPLGHALTRKNAQALLSELATANREVILATVQLLSSSAATASAESQLIQNFYTHHAAYNRAHNVLLVGLDDRTCGTLRSLNLPCYEDRMSNGWLADADDINPHGRVSLMKWWLASEILRMGFHVLYLDTATVAMGDVLSGWTRGNSLGYDFQAMSAADDSPHNREYNSPTKACPLFRNMPGAEMHQMAIPCISSAVFFANAMPSTQALLDGMVTAIEQRPGDWEMRLLQEVVVSYMIGEADSPVLKMRVLGLDAFAPYNVYSARKAGHLPLHTRAVHMGSVPPGQRHDALQQLGAWRPHEWDHGRVGRHRAAEILSRHEGLTTEDHSALWVAAMAAPLDSTLFIQDGQIGYHP
mmetsp:Transcript_39509/g.100950  ORF Transcript_39509/g.100950 Transcript_39509/m.100950 type:complete len:415 (+) Transcript_39509:224-1468(+)